MAQVPYTQPSQCWSLPSAPWTSQYAPQPQPYDPHAYPPPPPSLPPLIEPGYHRPTFEVERVASKSKKYRAQQVSTERSREHHCHLTDHYQACEQCRFRKQKCNEGSPCSFCSQHELECIYGPAVQTKYVWLIRTKGFADPLSDLTSSSIPWLSGLPLNRTCLLN